jgi:HEAT repeat protein
VGVGGSNPLPSTIFAGPTEAFPLQIYWPPPSKILYNEIVLWENLIGIKTIGRIMKKLEQLIDDLQRGTGIARSKAAAELGKLRDKKASDFLIKALTDANGSVRSNAAFALAELGEKRAAPYLIETLKDPEEWTRKSAAKALGLLGAKEAVGPLIKLLDDASFTVRKNVIRSLGQIGGPEARESLLRASAGQDEVVAHLAKEAIDNFKV